MGSLNKIHHILGELYKHYAPSIKTLNLEDINNFLVIYLLLSPIAYAGISIVTIFLKRLSKLQSFLKTINTLLISVYVIIFQMLLNKVLDKKHLIIEIDKENIPQLKINVINSLLQKLHLIDVNLWLNYAFYICCIILLIRLFDLFFRNPKYKKDVDDV